MPHPCKDFLKGQDQLGQGVNLNYKGNSNFGTIIGGICSLAATVFFFLFTMIQLYAWIFEPSYNQQITKSYLSRNDNVTYTIPTQTYIPMFAITTQDPSQARALYNDREYFSWQFNQIEIIGKTHISTPIEAVKCNDLINSWTDLSEDERNDLKDELFYQNSMICPNTTTLQVRGEIFSELAFELQVNATDAAIEQGIIGQSSVYSAAIGRYFSVDQYKSNGYLSPITQGQVVSPLIEESRIEIVSFVSEELDEFYD